MGAPQIIMIVMISLSFLANFCKAFTERTINDVALSVLSTIVGAGLHIGLLLWGGFFGG